MTEHKPTLLVDFDGVIHRYSAGWKDGSTYDSPMPGAKEALAQLTEEGYYVVIFSTRDYKQIVDYLKFWEFPEYEITHIKVPAVAIIDDRGIRFQNWGRALNDIHKFVPIGDEKEIQAEIDKLRRTRGYITPAQARAEVLQSMSAAKNNKESN